MIQYKNLIEIAIKASLNAGKKILSIYKSDNFNIQFKSDNSPLTRADLASNKQICDLLINTSIPILSEEEKTIDYTQRKTWTKFWMIDPLDGTKEFIKKNGEFTVNIALIENNKPVFGVIYTAVTNELFFSVPEKGSYKLINANKTFNNMALEKLISVSQKLPIIKTTKIFTIVGSRSHISKETEVYINLFKKKHNKIEILSKGSSLKLCLIAEGLADVYPRFAPTMEWDIAAGHAIIKAVGGNIINTKTKKELVYNKSNLLNPWFIAFLNKQVINI